MPGSSNWTGHAYMLFRSLTDCRIGPRQGFSGIPYTWPDYPDCQKLFWTSSLFHPALSVHTQNADSLGMLFLARQQHIPVRTS